MLGAAMNTTNGANSAVRSTFSAWNSRQTRVRLGEYPHNQSEARGGKYPENESEAACVDLEGVLYL